MGGDDEHKAPITIRIGSYAIVGTIALVLGIYLFIYQIVLLQGGLNLPMFFVLFGIPWCAYYTCSFALRMNKLRRDGKQMVAVNFFLIGSLILVQILQLILLSDPLLHFVGLGRTDAILPSEEAGMGTIINFLVLGDFIIYFWLIRRFVRDSIKRVI